nr:DUF1176 domain-containing protein [uncultured Celeribacter sp.]
MAKRHVVGRVSRAAGLALAFGVMSLGGAGVAQEASGTQDVTAFHHKQWRAACGPEYCSLHPRVHSGLALTRGHQGGPWLLTLDEDWIAVDETTQIMVDGAVLELPEGREVAFPAALMNGDLLEYVYEGNDFTGGYSLAGLTASVIWAEAQQGGPSTENRRLVRRTPDWEALAEKSAEIAGEICDYMGLDTDAPAGERRRIDTVPGAPELRRVTNRCWLAAYNAGAAVYLVGPDLDGLDPVRAAARAEDGPVEVLNTFEVASHSTQIFTFMKGRGVGDCFTEEAWDFDGFYYRLSYRDVDNDCDGKIIPLRVVPK